METHWEGLTGLLGNFLPRDLMLLTLEFLKIGIVSIESVEQQFVKREEDMEYHGFEGQQIILSDDSTLACLISSFDHGRGTFGSNILVPQKMEIEDFLGAYLIAPVQICDRTLYPVRIDDTVPYQYLYYYCEGEESTDTDSENESEEEAISVKVIRLLTNKGYIEQVVYNCHNGHYSHHVVIRQDGNDQWSML